MLFVVFNDFFASTLDVYLFLTAREIQSRVKATTYLYFVAI